MLGGRLLNSQPPFSLRSAPRALELVIRNGRQSYSEFQGFAEGERISCFIPGPTLKLLYTEREERKRRKGVREKRQNTRLEEIKVMQCKIVTAVSVFIGCFFWLHFFSNCSSYEQEGVQPGRAARWREAGGHSKDRQEGRAGGGGSESCTALGGDTHQSISFWQFHGSLSNRIQMHLRESF